MRAIVVGAGPGGASVDLFEKNVRCGRTPGAPDA